MMTRNNNRGHGRITPVPRAASSDKAPALDFVHLSSDAITLLRYAKAAQRQMLDSAPDTAVLRDVEECLAKCGDALSRLMTARQNTLKRYTTTGALKPGASVRNRSADKIYQETQ